MSRTKFAKVDNKKPLSGETDDLNHPRFLENLEDGFYEGRDRRQTKNGLKIKFKNDFMRQVYYLAKAGFRDEDMAEFFKVSRDTIATWKRSKPDFLEAYEYGHWMTSFAVVNTMVQSALGYDYTEVEYSQTIDRNGRKHDLKKVVHKHAQPNVAAICFYLKNKHSKIFSDAQKHEIDVKVQSEVIKSLRVEDLTPEQQALLKGVLLKQLSQTSGQSANDK